MVRVQVGEDLVHDGDSSTSARNLRQLIEKEKEIAATAS